MEKLAAPGTWFWGYEFWHLALAASDGFVYPPRIIIVSINTNKITVK